MTVIYTTHYMEEADRLCDRILIMDRGRVVVQGTSKELKAPLGALRRRRWKTFPAPDRPHAAGVMTA